MTAAAEAAREGAILAARWSIERLRRPTAPDLVWLGYAKPEVVRFGCLACGDAGFKQGVLRANGRTLYLCAACASHQVDPPELPAAAPAGFARRWLLEAGLDFSAAAATAARAMAGRAGGRLLDLGCGLGLVVDIVRHLPGWTARGVDSGPLPALGAEIFGAPLHAADIEAALADFGADVVLCEGALDRSADPLGLLQRVATAAAGARWLVATADAATLYASADGTEIRRLVDARLLLPSHVGLRRLLARAGLPDAAAQRRDGVLRVDPVAPAVAPEAAGLALDGYFAGRLAVLPEDAAAAVGLQVAVLQRATQRAVSGEGEGWAAARALLTALAPALAAAGEAARNTEAASSEALFARAPCCAAALLGQAGLFHLHDGGASMQALMCFELAALLSGRVLALAATPLPDEAERYWSARLQAALISRAMGDPARALGALRAIVADEERAAIPAPAWAARAQAEIAAMLAPQAEAVPPPRRRRVRAG